MTKKERYERVIAYFLEHMPVAETELEYGSPYELLVASCAVAGQFPLLVVLCAGNNGQATLAG